jgi:hypothetical protein
MLERAIGVGDATGVRRDPLTKIGRITAHILRNSAKRAGL